MDQIKPEFMKKLTKFIVISIWVSSLLITHNFYLYKLTIQLVTHAVDKKYMFLICNGLLVFVVKYSGLIGSSKPVEGSWSNTDQTFDSYDAMLELEYYSVQERETESILAEEVSTKDQETEEDQEDQETQEEKEDEEEESEEPLTDNGDLEEEECGIHGGFREEEDNNVGVVTEEEEMNKKFDEFIRKMKEELRIEAKRHLILV